MDALRGIAILLMIAYHFFFDLNYFGIAGIALQELPWVLFQRIVGSMFLLLVGVSLTLSEARNTKGYAHHAKRALFLGAIALAITIATWVYPHEAFIKFGIIHVIALSTLIAPFFFRFGKVNLLLGIAIIAVGLFAGNIHTDSPYLFWLGITSPDYTALDHYPMLPWFGVVLIGIYAGQTVFPNGKSTLRIRESRPLPKLVLAKLAFMGRNSLAVYLIHQPVLVAAMLILKGVGA